MSLNPADESFAALLRKVVSADVLRPIEPRVRLRAIHATATRKIRQNKYLAGADVLGPVTIIPNTVRSGELIIPEAELL